MNRKMSPTYCEGSSGLSFERNDFDLQKEKIGFLLFYTRP